MRHPLLLVAPPTVPPLDPSFRPAVLGNRAFRSAVAEAGGGVPLRIALERADGSVSVYETRVFASGAPDVDANLTYAERVLKFLLWKHGGWRATVGGPPEIGRHLREVYAVRGARDFDARLMGEIISERQFEVVVAGAGDVPDAAETTVAMGRHLDGCRVGFDLGASDRKTSAVIDGKDVFSEEVAWDPRNATDWRYHDQGIRHAIDRARAHLPRLDGVGGSAAGVYVHNRVMAASLFRGVPPADFERHVKPLFENLGRELGVPLVVVNDGEVTALAGSMSLEGNAVLGIAMGSSEAAGYVTPAGTITGWLNELAFVPVDYAPAAPVDEWSGDIGCGVQYFSQQAVMRLAACAGLPLDAGRPVPERLVQVQEWMQQGKPGVREIYATLGVWLGYAIAHYADFYSIEHCLILGRVTTGSGGEVLLDEARGLLEREFPELAERIELLLPSEKLRRVGQAIAAASLPRLG